MMNGKTMSGLVAAALAVAVAGSTASATLLVYEPFAYTPDAILTGQGGALGTTGVWNTFDTISGADTGNGEKTQDWFVHAQFTQSGVGLSGANGSVEPSGMHRWDGTVANLATAGGYVGLWGADDWSDPDGPNTGEPGRNLSGDIGLDPSVTATFQSNTTTWISYVSVRGWDRNEEHPNLVLATDPAPDGSRGDNFGGIGNGGSGFGTGGGPTRNNRTDIFPMFYDTGQHNNVNGAIPNNSFGEAAFEVSEADSLDWVELDPDGFFGPPNIVVVKLEWDADTGGEDIISVARFLEGDTLSEANFDAMIAAQPNLSSANWVAANKPNLDQSQLDTLTFMGLKYFVDEVRLGESFADVTPAPGPPPNCDFDNDSDCDLDDVDALSLVGDLGAGVAVPPADAKFDLSGDSTVNQIDLNIWLGAAATSNGFGAPFRPGDNDLDRDVDITDFNTLATNFSPAKNATNKFSLGDGDGDGDIDITDFNVLASGFAPGGYDAPGSAAVSADADPGQIDLIVDLATGEVLLDGNGAQASGIQVFSPSGSLLAADMTPALLQFVISTNATTYAEGAFANIGVNGLVSLGVLFDLAKGVQDLTFEYTSLGQATQTGRVIFIPEPASLVLMGMGVLALVRRRRAA